MKTISSIASNIQYALLVVQDHMGELSSDYKALVSILEFVRIEEFLPCTRFNFGRPLKDRKFIARAFVAKVVLKHTYTQSLIRELKANKQLRMICGWDEHSKIPLKSQFSRAFKEFAKSNLLEKVHQALIKKTYGDKIVGHLIKDSTPIIAREKALKKVGSSKDRKKMMNKKSLEDKKNGTSRKQNQLKQNLTEMIADLPTACDIGAKKSASGFRVVWKGYKMHVVVDDNCVPIAVITTSASLNDGEVAIPLAEKAKNLVSNFYD